MDDAELDRLRRVRVPFRHLSLFARQLVTLLQGGVPLVRSLEALSVQEEYPEFGRLIADVTRRVGSGYTFSQALSLYPQMFPRIFVVMVEIGENTGGLALSLERLAGWLERDGQLVQRVRSALTYPSFVMVLALVLTLLLFYSVMPGFLGIFAEMQIDLPLITRVVLGITQAVRNPLVWVGLGLLGLGLLRLARAAWRDPEGKVFFYELALHIPILRGILWNGGAARYCSAVETLLSSGTNLERTLRLAAAVSGSPLLLRDVDNLAGSVLEGNLASEHMALHPRIYSPTMAHMAAAGEEASRLPELFGRAAHFHSMEMESQLDELKAALEPIMLVAVASLVGTIILSIFLPLYGFLSRIG